MKKYFSVLLLAFSLSVLSQTVIDPSANFNSDINQSIGENFYEDDSTEVSSNSNDLNPVKSKTLTNLSKVEEGYYIIANVFGAKKNLKRFGKALKKKGITSNHISYENLNYVYIEQYDNWEDAKTACETKMYGSYSDTLWVLIIDNHPTSDNTDENGVIDILETTGGEEKSSASENNFKGKLIQRADLFFNKLWYSEAAALYEEALEKNEDNYTFDVIQKAGDSHYFNTNMKRAYHWYNILYDRYSDEMSADNIFKYAHSLKGTGKYSRAKRLMRLYNRKMEKDEADPNGNLFNDRTLNEVILDNILASENSIEIKNMAINSKNSDFAPMYMDSNNIVFASAVESSNLKARKYKWNGQPFLDLYVAQFNDETEELKNAVKFSKKINTKYHEASVTFSPDKKTMYFTRNNYGKKLRRDNGGINHLKTYMSKNISGEWTEATELPFNSDEYSTGHPALSTDGKKLYFVSDMPGSMGDTDIFVVDVLENGKFSEPKNLGPNINTEQKEMFPFIMGEKLYFSSNGHTGLGGLDVFEAVFDEEVGFSKVVNLGKPINSNKDDFSYIVDKESKKGFFASNREGGKGDDDIYSFKVFEKIPENNNTIVGIVTELISGDDIPQAMVQLLDENGIKLKEMLTEEDGSFMFEDLDDNAKYTLKTIKEYASDDVQEITTTVNDTVHVEVKMRKLKEIIVYEDGVKKVKTEKIHFDFDGSYIRTDASLELDKLVTIMTEYPDMVIKIESHTDSRGTKAYNRYLSNKRAESTKDYIIAKGIDPSRIESAIGYGEDRLFNECDGTVRCTETAHYLNRRSEFIIVKM